MVSMEKAFLFFSLLKAIFQLFEIWLVNPFPAPKTQKTHYLHNLWIRKKVADPFHAPSVSVKNKNKNKTSNFFLFLWQTIYACKMGAPHCSSAPFMSAVPELRAWQGGSLRSLLTPHHHFSLLSMMGTTEASAAAFLQRAGRQVSGPSSGCPAPALISPSVLSQSISNSQVSFFLKNNY